MKEKTLERKLGEEVKKAGGLCIKMDAFTFAGIPDRMVLLNPGFMFFVEVKTQGEKPTSLQLSVHKKLISLGFSVYVLDSNEMLTYLKDVIGKRRFA